MLVKNIKSLITKQNAFRMAAGLAGALVSIWAVNRYTGQETFETEVVMESETVVETQVAPEAEPVVTTTRKRRPTTTRKRRATTTV